MNEVLYCIDVDSTVLLYNFEKRGWIHVGPDDKWNLYWSSVKTCNCLFNPQSNIRLNDNQLINHFPNYYELSRKDFLIRNIKRYHRETKNSGSAFMKHENRGMCSYFDSIPPTYILPNEYSTFVEDFRKKSNIWIMKPCGKSRGTGIFLINKLSQVKKWLDRKNKKENYIISRYIDNPFLICGKKFDLRLYVVVTSFRPLRAYQFKYGFCRFCSVKYAPLGDLNCLFAHLTNISVQKEGDQYNNVHGGKWSTENLKLYLTSTRGQEPTQTLFYNISRTIIHSLKAVSKVMSQNKHCFECYGYDIIVDENLKPWLIEVNSSPSLASTTVSDQILKSKLVESILSLVLPPTGIPDSRWDKNPTPESLVNFDVLINEA